MALLLRDGSPSGVSMVSQLPWSARMKSPTPAWSHRGAARSAKAATARGKGRCRRGREGALRGCTCSSRHRRVVAGALRVSRTLVHASRILPMHMSVCVVASMALSIMPVWPTCTRSR